MRRPRRRVPTRDAPQPAGKAADPPGWDGGPRGEPGIHGIPRARRWDAVVSVRERALAGDHLGFVALPGGEVLCDDGDARSVAPLVAALVSSLEPPYRAEAVRRDADTWALAASRITTVDLGAFRGRDAELVLTRDGRSLRVDGLPCFDRVPELERAGAAEGPEHVVRAKRLAGGLWEVESAAL